MAILKVFIGSSDEAKRYAQYIQDLLFELDVKAIGWWDDDVFPVGPTLIESIFDLLSKTDAAILLATEDDQIVKRGASKSQPRDNVLLEYGLFAATHGRKRTAIAKLGDPQLPTDLSGVTYLDLEQHADQVSFKAHNRKHIIAWLNQVKEDIKEHRPPEESMPRLFRAITIILKDFAKTEPTSLGKIDLLGADLLDAISGSFKPSHFITAGLVAEMSQDDLMDCVSIRATDVLGPAAWVTPTAYRYLALQINRYIRANVRDEQWCLRVDHALGKAIRAACSRATAPNIYGNTLNESLSEFDNPADYKWEESDKPVLQFSRVLLWEKGELLSPIGESVIAIHEAFHVPLFYKEAKRGESSRASDFVIFEKKDGRVSGFYNAQVNGFAPKRVERERIPNEGKCLDTYAALLSEENLMLAVDARELLKSHPPAPSS